MPDTAADIGTDALREIGVLNSVDPPSGEDAALALNKLNRLLDNWNADRGLVYADTIVSNVLTPALNPHTIGPTGDVDRHPAARVDQCGEHRERYGFAARSAIRDAAWWVSQPDQTFSADRPSDLYYEPAWPNGKIYLLGVPGAAYTLELLIRVVLAQLALSDTFTLPPGYKDAITLTLAEDLVGPMRVPIPPLLPGKAKEARARIFGANLQTPRLQTRDSGMPGGRRSTFNYESGRSR
jgi:hypothetical protein